MSINRFLSYTINIELTYRNNLNRICYYVDELIILYNRKL